MKRLVGMLAGASLLVLAGAANAAPVDWNFGDHLGALGNTQTFTSSGPGLNLTARGFDPADHGTALFGKSAGSGETGLGLVDDPSGEDEITGRNFIQLNLDGIRSELSNIMFSMNSVTQGETWAVYGSEDGSPFTFTLLASGNDELLHSLAGGYDDYDFFYTGGPPGTGTGGCGSGCSANVLLGSFDATLTATPLPAALPMFLGGLGVMGLLARRKRRSTASAFGTVTA